MADVYDFSGSFQTKILALLWRDSSFFTLYSETVKPQYFESEIHIDLARIIFTHYEKYEEPPSLEAMEEEVRTLVGSSKIKSKKSDEYYSEVNKLVEANLNDMSYVRDKVIEFGKRQAVTQAILDSIDDVKAGKNYDKVEERIKSATQVGEDIGDHGTDYFSEESIDARLEETYEKSEDLEKIPTGIELLDRVMGGGLGRKELGIVIAPPGTGKTLTLINIGASAINNNKNVLHLSFEMSEEKVAQRYDMKFLNRSKDAIKGNLKKVSKALKMLGNARKGKLIIKEFPTRTCTPDTVRALVTKLRISKGFVPDLIILDYPDIMKPSRTYGERRHELEMLYEDVRALGSIFDCAVWGASQTNRSALDKKVVTIADLAESFGKAAVADFMIALSQTKKEKKLGQVRYYIAKHRNGTDGETIHCDIWYEKMTVQSNEERESAFDMEDDDEDDIEENNPKKKTFSGKRRKKKGNDGSEVASAIMNEMNGV